MSVTNVALSTIPSIAPLPSRVNLIDGLALLARFTEQDSYNDDVKRSGLEYREVVTQLGQEYGLDIRSWWMHAFKSSL